MPDYQFGVIHKFPSGCGNAIVPLIDYARIRVDSAPSPRTVDFDDHMSTVGCIEIEEIHYATRKSSNLI